MKCKHSDIEAGRACSSHCVWRVKVRYGN